MTLRIGVLGGAAIEADAAAALAAHRLVDAAYRSAAAGHVRLAAPAR